MKSGETSFIKDISALYAKKTKNDNFNTNLVKLISELDTNTDNAEENNRRSTESEKYRLREYHLNWTPKDGDFNLITEISV